MTDRSERERDFGTCLSLPVATIRLSAIWLRALEKRKRRASRECGGGVLGFPPMSMWRQLVPKINNKNYNDENKKIVIQDI